MLPYIQFTSFHIGPIILQVWGLMVSLGILASMIVSYFLAKKKKLDYQKIPDLTFWAIFSAMIGARIFFILGEFSYYWQNPLDVFKFWEGGMSISGGLVFGVLAGYLFSRYYHWNFWDYAEIIVFSMPLGLGIGRLGCFFIFDHPGTVTTFFLGERYIDGLIRHNHGLYLSLEGFLIFIFFSIIYIIFCRDMPWHDPTKNFIIFIPLFLILDGLTRLILDFWRIIDPRYFGLTIAQYLGILMIGLGVIILCKLTRKQIKSPRK